jgi:hypothetical protein
MAHSRRKNPVTGVTTARSEKAEKAAANRTLRRLARRALRIAPDATVLPDRREVSDPWCMSKDGKMRFDPLAYPGLLRK